MDQIVEMGASCGTNGCGEVTVEQTAMGTRCRSITTGGYTPCPPGISRNKPEGVGFFLKKDGFTGKGQLPWGKTPGADWSAISTPNVRWPNNPVASRTYHALKQPGVRKYEAKYPGQVRMLFSGGEYDRSAAELAAQRRIKSMRMQAELPMSRYGYGTRGIGRFGGYPPFRVGRMGATYGPFNFDLGQAMSLKSPIAVQPMHLVLGNLAGGFAPGLVNYAIENVAMPDLARSALRFGLAASGAFLILFGRSNGYLLGAGLALLPQTISSLMSFVKGMARQPAAQVPQPDTAVEGIGQWTPAEKTALARETRKTFGQNIQGAGKRLGFARGFETVVPDDFGDLSRSSVQVAGRMSGLGENPFRPLGS